MAWCSRRTASARERAIASALRVTAEAVQHHVNEIIAREIARANEKLAAAQISSSGFRMSPKFKNPRAQYNFQGRTCSITGVGSYVPAKILTNADLEKMVDTSDEWITTRTGIKERRHGGEGRIHLRHGGQGRRSAR